MSHAMELDKLECPSTPLVRPRHMKFQFSPVKGNLLGSGKNAYAQKQIDQAKKDVPSKKRVKGKIPILSFLQKKQKKLKIN